MIQRNSSCLVDEFQRNQSWIAAAYAEYLAEEKDLRYSELEALKALAFYLKTDQARYELILEKLRPRMKDIQRGGRVMSISWEA